MKEKLPACKRDDTDYFLFRILMVDFKREEMFRCMIFMRDRGSRRNDRKVNYSGRHRR